MATVWLVRWLVKWFWVASPICLPTAVSCAVHLPGNPSRKGRSESFKLPDDLRCGPGSSIRLIAEISKWAPASRTSRNCCRGETTLASRIKEKSSRSIATPVSDALNFNPPSFVTLAIDRSHHQFGATWEQVKTPLKMIKHNPSHVHHLFFFGIADHPSRSWPDPSIQARFSVAIDA